MRLFFTLVLICLCCSFLLSQANDEIVVLIHGLRGTADDMRIIAETLLENDFVTLNFTYPSHDHEIQILAKQFLEPAIEKIIETNPSQIHFVTHSMGAIVLRSYLEENHTEIDSLLGKVVMIAPPNQGSEVTDFFQKNPIYKKRYGISGQQIGFELEKQLGLSDSVYYKPGIIAGTDTQFPYFSWFIPGKDDGKISVDRTKIKGMVDFLEMHYPHDTIMKKKAVIDQVLHFLLYGRFKK